MAQESGRGESSGGAGENLMRDRVAVALSSDIPKLYANSFAIVMGSADSTLVLERNGKPIAVLNLSFTAAKTLSMKLGALLSSLEQNSGLDIITTDDVERVFAKTGGIGIPPSLMPSRH